MKKKIKELIKKAIAIFGFKEQKIFGMKVISYRGVPENELWIFTKNRMYKYIPNPNI